MGFPDTLSALLEAEKMILRLIEDEAAWKTLDITYEKPKVQRVWRSLDGLQDGLFDGYRLSLHRIHPCEERESYMHPHTWTAAMRMMAGRYEMVTGYGEGLEPVVLGKFILAPGSYYSMEHPNFFHSVRPLDDRTADSVMISGRPNGRPMPIEKPAHGLGPLTSNEKIEIMESALRFYQNLLKGV